jgi:deoxycytidylate deaminase
MAKLTSTPDEKGKKRINSGTMLYTCKCIHAQQDSLHGKSIRAFNGCSGGWRCTVCKSERS